MESVSVVNHVLTHIVQEGKEIMKDKFISKEKVPYFVNDKVKDFNFEAIIHGGYQLANTMRGNYFSMRKDKMPEHIKKDGQAPTKAQIQMQSRVKPNTEGSPKRQKRQNRSFSFSGLSSRKYKSMGFSPSRPVQKQKQKENKFIKLQQKKEKRIVIDRVKLKEQMEIDQLRNQKQKSNLQKYKEKKANEIISNNKNQDKQAKEKLFQQHTSRGQSYKFYYHQGQLVLYREDESDQALTAHQARYHVEGDDIPSESNSNGSSHYFKRSNPKTVNDHFQNQEHHRIRSAKGEVFASSVLKTINLSRISLNETLRNLDDQHFMKRNDLFNNNHARQTTCIPYMLPKTGTVYTQLSTNQIVGNAKNETDDRQSCSFKSETTRNPISNRRKSHFQPYINQDLSRGNFSQRMFEQKQMMPQMQVNIDENRSIKTAQALNKRRAISESRPKTSVSRGRITAANQDLVVAFLK